MKKIGKTRHGKNIDKSKEYILRGHRNVRFCDKILSNQQKYPTYILT